MSVAERAHATLLRACVGDGAAAVDAWCAWSSTNTLEDHDDPSFALFPLLHRNLARLGWDGPELGRLRGVSRQTWYRNRLLVHHATRALETLDAAGVPTMLLGGAAMATAARLDDFGARPIEDFDVLIARADAVRALATLQDAGWQPSPVATSLGQWIECHDAIGLSADAATTIRLHWDLLPAHRSPAREAALLERAVATTLDAVPVLVPGVGDHLLHLLAVEHGADLRWIADCAYLVVGAGGTPDWHQLIGEARDRRALSAVARNVARVEALLPGTLPPHVVDRIARARRHPTDRVVGTAPGGNTRLQGAVKAVTLILQRTRHLGPAARIRTGRALVREGFGARSAGSLVRAVVTTAVRGTRSRRGAS